MTASPAQALTLPIAFPESVLALSQLCIKSPACLILLVTIDSVC